MRGGGGAPRELGGYIPRELGRGGGEPGRSRAHVGTAGRGGISRGGLALAVGGPRLTSPTLQRPLRVQGGATQAEGGDAHGDDGLVMWLGTVVPARDLFSWGLGVECEHVDCQGAQRSRRA